MRKMFSEKQIKRMIQESPSEVVEALRGQDINVEGITSKGIANTGNIGNIGDVAITGDLSASGAITGNEIVENMSGYSFDKTTKANLTLNYIYAGVVKNGNKITFAINVEVTRTGEVSADNFLMGSFNIPSEIGAKLFASSTIGLENVLATQNIYGANSYYQGVDAPVVVYKQTGTRIAFTLYSPNGKLTANVLYNFRIEQTFLLSENLASEE